MHYNESLSKSSKPHQEKRAELEIFFMRHPNECLGI